MKTNSELSTKYLKKLEELTKQWNEAAEVAKKAGEQEKFVHGKIQVNVANIFQKMFTISYQNVYEALTIPKLKKHIEAYDKKEEQLRAAYLNFFAEIPAPWKEKAEKDKKFGKEREYAKEMLKLQALEEIQTLFLATYQEVYGGEYDGR